MEEYKDRYVFDKRMNCGNCARRDGYAANPQSPWCAHCTHPNKHYSSALDHLLERLRTYRFIDSQGHPLENCLDYLELVSVLVHCDPLPATERQRELLSQTAKNQDIPIKKGETETPPTQGEKEAICWCGRSMKKNNGEPTIEPDYLSHNHCPECGQLYSHFLLKSPESEQFTDTWELEGQMSSDVVGG